MSKKQEQKPDHFGFFCEQFADWMHSIFTGAIHVSVAKEEMSRQWKEIPEEDKREFAIKAMEAFDRSALSLESLRQEFTIFTVKHRQ